MTQRESFESFLASRRERPTFVVLGVQGSGTNLLSKLLRRLFNVSVLHDQALVVRLAGQLGPAPTAGEIDDTFRQMVSAISPSQWRRRVTKQALHADGRFEGIERHFSAAQVTNGPELARFVYAYRAFRSSATDVAIKSDDIWAHMPALARVLPDRRIVLLTRDFRDNVVSVMHKPFGPVEPLIAATYVHHRFRCYEQEYHARRPDGCHVRFEDLIHEPRRTLERLAERLGLEPGVPIPEFLATFPFRAGRVGRWKRLSPRDLAWCETMFRRELIEYGYGLATSATSRPSAADHWTAVARDCVGRVPQKLRSLVRRLGQ